MCSELLLLVARGVSLPRTAAAAAGAACRRVGYHSDTSPPLRITAHACWTDLSTGQSGLARSALHSLPDLVVNALDLVRGGARGVAGQTP